MDFQKTAAQEASTNPFAPRTSVSLRQRLMFQLRIVLLITLAFGVLESLIEGRPSRDAFLYPLLISTCCSAIIQSLNRLLLHLLNAYRPAGQAPRPWLGWPWLIASLIFGTILGYAIGSSLGDWVTGRMVNGLGALNPQQAMAVLLVSLIPGIAVTLYFVARARVESAHALAMSAQRAAAENQLRLLQSQLEPHMLFNTLANLRVLIGMDPARAQQMLDQLIAFLRATLTASRAENHPLQDEFDRLRDYLALMQIRMGQRLRTTLSLPEDLANTPIAPLLLQPLVENAIKHGLEPAIDGGELIISAQRLGEQLQLEVQDSGVGLEQASLRSESLPGTRFGLQQVRERLATLYGEHARLTLGPAPGGGTLARILLPLPGLKNQR